MGEGPYLGPVTYEAGVAEIVAALASVDLAVGLVEETLVTGFATVAGAVAAGAAAVVAALVELQFQLISTLNANTTSITDTISLEAGRGRTLAIQNHNVLISTINQGVVAINNGFTANTTRVVTAVESLIPLFPEPEFTFVPSRPVNVMVSTSSTVAVWTALSITGGLFPQVGLLFANTAYSVQAASGVISTVFNSIDEPNVPFRFPYLSLIHI